MIEEENDSFEDEPVSRREMIQLGLDRGASYLFICADDRNVDAAYAYPGDCVGTFEKRCLRASYSVEIIDLDEIRKQGALS